MIKVKTGFDFDEQEEPEKNDKNPQKDIMSIISGGIDVIKKKKMEYVDPLVKTGINNITKKWNESENKKQDMLQQQKLMRQKLK